MSLCNWLTRHPLGRSVALVLSLGVALWLIPDEPHHERGYSATNEQQAKANPFSLSGQKPSAEASTNPCKAPHTNQEQDLCQQWRMANSTALMADQAEIQINIGIWNIVLLFFAVAFAGWAAREANAAARYTKGMLREAEEATKAAQTMAEISVASEQPIIMVSDIVLGMEGITYHPAERCLEEPLIRVTVKNHGKTPAFIDHVVINFCIAPLPPKPPRYVDYSWLTSPIPLQHGETKTFRESTLLNERPYGTADDFRKRGAHLWAYGFIDYFDAFGQWHRRGYCGKWDDFSKRMSAERTAEYDYYQKREGPIEKPDFTEELVKALERFKKRDS